MKMKSVLLISIVALLVSSVPSSLVSAAVTDAPVYVSQFTAGGPTTFNYPAGIATDPSGNVFVADGNNHRIQKFTNAGVYISEWGSAGSGDGQIGSAFGIATDPNGNVFVADTANARIQKFSNTGTFLTKWGNNGSGDGQFQSAEGIATDTAGNVYVVEYNGHRLQKFSNTGTFLTKWGGLGSGNGQFNAPRGVTVDSSGNVYVADTNNSRIQKFDSSGVYVTKWGSAGNGNGQFNYPYGLTLDTNGNLYVADANNSRIQKFSSTGTYLAQWGNEGCSWDGPISNTNLCFAADLASDANDNFFIIDTYNDRVLKFAYPVTTATFADSPSSGATAPVTLSTPAGTNITAASSVAASTVNTDAGKSYPLGLVNFTFTATAGSTNQVVLTFVTPLLPSQVTARKYNSTTHVYTDIPGATITETTVSGQHALKLTYNITDGGVLDQDGVVNGIVVDPVGLAQVTISATAAELVDTGLGLNQATFVIDVIAGLGLTTVGWMAFRSHRRHYTYKK